MKQHVFTIGHSRHPAEQFIQLLELHGVTAIADVRTHPYSRLNPLYNRETLQQTLAEHGIAYVFLGRELGARSDDPSCYVDGRVQFDRLARAPLFQRGLERIREGAEQSALRM